MKRGIAAFLLPLIVLVCFCMTPCEGFSGEKASEEVPDPDEISKDIEEIGEVNIQAANDKTETEIKAVQKDEGIIVYASAPAASKKVTMTYTKRINYENFFTRNFSVKCDGKTEPAYCIQPKEYPMGKGSHTGEKTSGALMNKVLYYSYGYPGYSLKTKEYLAGVSRKSCYKGNDGVFALCHLALSYVYDGESADSDAFKGISSETKTVMKNLVKKIKTWPDPPKTASMSFSRKSLQAVWDEETQIQTTDKITVKSSSGNKISVPVPEHAVLHKKTGSSEKEYKSGKVSITGGDSFYFTAGSEATGKYKSPTMAGSVVPFSAYIIKVSGKQNLAFGASGTPTKISYSIQWADFGNLELLKQSDDEEVTDGNDYYSLEGAEYGLYSAEDDSLYGKLFTAESGEASLSGIPYGEYYLKEEDAPKGYALDETVYDISVQEPNVVQKVGEEPLTGGLEFVKVTGDTGKSMPNVEFEVNCPDTGQSFTVISGKDGKVVLKDLPLGEYVFNEIRSDANVNYQLIRNLKITLDGTARTLEIGNVKDSPIEIRTTARDALSGTGNCFCGEHVSIVDTISYKGLEKNRTYTVRGTVMDKSTGKSLIDKTTGLEVTAAADFVPAESQGSVEVAFDFDGSGLKGKTLVVFEELYLDGKLEAYHRDINDGGQSVIFPEIRTSAREKNSGSNIINPAGSQIIVDTVSYSGLVPGREYRLTGSLVDKSTGRTIDGVTGETSFVADRAEGRAKVNIKIDGRKLEGKTLVVFEKLYVRGGVERKMALVAEHADINDGAQTVTIKKPGDVTPATGDDMPFVPLIVLMVLCGLACLILLYFEVRRLLTPRRKKIAMR